MLHIQVVQAKSLKFPRNNIQKTCIICYSDSSKTYYYGYFINKHKTTNPQWNGEFDVFLFHASTLRFMLYIDSIFIRDKFLGKVEIDIYSFFSQGEGKNLISHPNESFEFQFPISKQDATLYLSITYINKTYPPMSFLDIPRPILHLWLTYENEYQYDGFFNPINLEMIQIKTGFYNSINGKNITYSYFNQYNSWETTRVLSSEKNIFVEPQFTQIHTFDLYYLSDQYDFLILNVGNYTGKVTLNFVVENIRYLSDMKPIIGTIKTIDIHVESNKKYAVPLYIHYNNSYQNKDLEIESIPTNDLIIEKKEFDDYFDFLMNEKEFHNEIVNIAKEVIPSLQNSNIIRNEFLPERQELSLKKIFRNAGLNPNSKIRIYIEELSRINPFFIIYDREKNKKRKSIQRSLSKKLYFNIFRSGFYHKFGFLVSSFIDLDLNNIGTNKIIYYNVENQGFCKASIHITYFDDDNEILLFSNSCNTNNINVTFCNMLQFRYVNDDWKINIMNRALLNKKEMDLYIKNGQ